MSCGIGELQQHIAMKVLPMDAGSASAVYFLVKDGECVYVGQSDNVFARVWSHKKINQISFDTVFYIPCEIRELNEIERLSILLMQPKHNGPPISYDRGANNAVDTEKCAIISALLGRQGLSRAVSVVDGESIADTNSKSQLLNTNETAALLGVSPITLRKDRSMRTKNMMHLPYIKLGRTIRYDISDIRAFVNKQRRTI